MSPTNLAQRIMDNLPVALPAAAALICAVLAQYLSHPDAELPSELLCWIALPLLYWLKTSGSRQNTYGRREQSREMITLGHGAAGLTIPQSLGQWAYWIPAVAIASTALSFSEIKSMAFVPALTPFVAFAHRKWSTIVPWTPTKDDTTIDKLVDSPLVLAVVAKFSVAVASRGDVIDALPSLIPFGAMLLLHLSMIPRSRSISPAQLERHSLQGGVSSLAWRTVVTVAMAVGMLSFFPGSGWPGLVTVLALSVVKVAMWCFLITTTSQTSWVFAPVAKTFAVLSTTNPWSYTSELQALAFVLASLLTLGQAIALLPRHNKWRMAVWVLAVVPVAPYLSNAWTRSELYANPPRWEESHSGWDEAQQVHPVEKLIEKAQSDFTTLRTRQSKTYQAASDEYRRRYGMAPPPGFKEWYDYATKHKSPIIDDYDAIHDSIAPFLHLSGKDVKQLMEKAYRKPGIDLWSCSMTGEKAAAQCSHTQRPEGRDRDISILLNKVLGDTSESLRDVRILVNHLDEPRVIYSPRNKADGNFEMRILADEPAWKYLTKHCTTAGFQHGSDGHPMDNWGFPMIANRTGAMNLCHHRDYRDMYGLFVQPANLRLIEGHVPVFGTGCFSTMGEILIASPAYIQDEFRYDQSADVPWEDKRSTVFWAGSTTGGRATGDGDDKWRFFHRQRFVSFVQNLENQVYYYIRQVGSRAMEIDSHAIDTRLYDVAFTRIFQCDRPACRAQRFFFRTRSWTSSSAAFRSQLVFDLDGNGISGRFYSLLASNSLPLKQTLLKEWHDERLVPWVHYVPVSLEMGELPEVVQWLTSTERGRVAAKKMADAGRDWFREAIRDVDMGIYLYRVMIEMRRLQDVTREAGQT